MKNSLSNYVYSQIYRIYLHENNHRNWSSPFGGVYYKLRDTRIFVATQNRNYGDTYLYPEYLIVQHAHYIRHYNLLVPTC